MSLLLKNQRIRCSIRKTNKILHYSHIAWCIRIPNIPNISGIARAMNDQNSNPNRSIRPNLEADIRTAMNNAQEMCYRHGISFKCMRAWERVDDLVKKYYELNESYPQEVVDESVIDEYHTSCTESMCNIDDD